MPAPVLPQKPKRFREDVEPLAEAPTVRPSRPQIETKAGAVGAWPQTDAASAVRAANARPPLPAIAPPPARPALPALEEPRPKQAAPVAARPIKPTQPVDADPMADDKDDAPEAARPFLKKGLAQPQADPPSVPQTAHGFFARMKERLRILFTIKPSDDDDDWGDEEVVAGRPEPEGREPVRSPPRQESGDAADRDRAIETPAAKSAPKLRPAPSPPQQRRPTTAMRHLSDADPSVPAWQARLRRATMAEAAR